jgi:3-hydroxyisobutyrate dehydrogenase-like beta-hydroxyacid dehydrogenase
MQETIGFIGLGAMGGAMAANLRKAGFTLIVNDIDPVKEQPLLALGAKPASSAAEVARRCALTITMVETTAETEQVLIGAEGVLAGAAPGHVVAMMSTIDPNAAKRIHDRLREAGIAMLDAPVSGGTARARSGHKQRRMGLKRAAIALAIARPRDEARLERPQFQALHRFPRMRVAA